MDIHELINRCDVIAVQAMQLKEALLKGNLDDKPSANSLAINRQAKGLCVLLCGANQGGRAAVQGCPPALLQEGQSDAQRGHNHGRNSD
jgi:hypothetical protein